MTSDPLPVTERTRLRRNHLRGSHDRETINAILDATPMCHVGYLLDGKPAVTPTVQWREGDQVYWHGSAASRALRNSTDAPVCLTVTLFDGLVIARSGFHHSANYRSVMIYGNAVKIDDHDQKAAALDRFVDHLFPGRSATLRPATDQEVKATTVLSMRIEEASAKVRTGPPVDDDEDYALPIWAGVIPLSTAVGTPQPDPRNLDGVALPSDIAGFRLDGKGPGTGA